ncbi:MAG: T9SS type A sorting domain-containing protein [Bacteroidetes bacterium]|nr:T9SS type A sorting domain-containing protein [Bacteroidota bacterium]
MKDGVFDNIDIQLAIFQETVIGTCNTVQPPQSPVSSIVSYNILDGYGEEMYVNCLTPGRKYYIMVDGSASPLTQTRGIFDLRIEDFPANSFAPNDEMQDAIAFTNTYTATSTWNRINNKVTESILNTKNWCADNLNEPGRPVLGGYNETGVWYKFIAPPSGMVHFLAENTTYASLSKPSGDPNHLDLSLAVYQLNAGFTASQYSNPAATTLIQQDYQNPLVTSGIAALGTSVEDEEMIVECLTPGREYYLLVSGKKSSGIGSDWDYGRFNLYMTAHPRNPAKWNGATVTVSGNQYLPTPLPASIDSVCNAANLGTMPAGTAWFQPFGDRQVPINCGSNFYQSPTFNNFCATATSDPVPGYQQDLINVFGGNHKPVWFKFTTPATGAYDASRISVEVEVISGDCDAGILDDWYDNACTPSDEEYQDCINMGVSVWLPSAVPTLCNTSLYEMDSDFDFDIIPSGEQADIHCLDPNTEYYIMVDGGSTNQEGNFNVRVRQITPDPRPFNNYICNAKKLTTGSNTAVASFWGGGAAFTYAKDTNICADTRKDISSGAGTEPIPSGWDVISPPSDAADMTNTVWYSFLTPAAVADYAVHIDVNSELPWPFGDLVNPKIAVWESQDGSCNYTHPNGTNMVEMASEYDPLAFWGESIDVFCLKPNTRYFVQVGGTVNVYGQDQGYFDIVINDIPPITIPLNDNVCSALNVGGGTLSSVIGAKIGDANSGANNYHNYCTDLEAGEPVPSAFTADNTVWFKFTTPATAGKRYDVTVNANSDPAPDHNDGINLQLALYEATSGCNFAGFTEIASDFDGLLYDETLTATCLKPSTTYYIQLDGSKGFLELFRAQGFGYFGIEVVTDDVYDAPVNDNLCNATNLGTVPVAGQLAPATWFYNSCATLEVGEIDPVGDVIDYDIDKTVWFKFVPGRDADFKISAISDCLIGAGCDPIDLQVGLFRPTGGLAPTCPSLTYATLVQEAADYDPGFFDEDLTAPCLKAGQTYYIQVDGSALNIDGEFQIKIEDVGSSVAAPLNDNFCNATLMTFTAGVASLTNQNNVCATIQASEPQTPASVQKSVWYKFQAPPSGRIRITTHDADGAFRGLDPEFYVYENGPVFNCAAFTNLTANGDDYNPIPDVPIICPNCGDEEVEDECFVPGWWYLIQVDGTTIGGPQGKFDIKIEDLLTPYTVGSGNKPANDDFASATTLTIQTEACSEGSGRTDLHGSGTWDPENYGKSTRDMINGFGDAGCSIADLCGDLWYKFIVTSPTCNNGYSPMIIQGKAESSLLEGSKLHIIAYKGSAGALTVLGCGEASSTLSLNSYFNFEINEAIGTTIYLQVFGENADDWDEDFEICVSEKRGFDYCAHAAASPPMTYGVDYCYNVKGATLETAANGYAESCPLTGIPGLPDPDSDAPTENSVYFKFVTDNTCSDYRLNFKYYFTGYSALSDKGISYTIYKDDTPCDGVALGSGALDCQSFYNNNAGSFEYDILFRNNSYLATATGIDNNSTYYIQIDGPGNNFGNLDGTLKITQIPICLPIVIDSVPSQTLTTFYTCGDGWRHYYRLEGGVRKYKWSLFDNGNTSLQGDVTLTYNTGANFYSATNGCIEASWVMRRYWNYNVTGGSIAADKPVSIRFYYIPAEKQAIIDQMNTFAATGCDGFVESFEWFKSHDGVAFNPALHIDPEYVIARYGSGGSTSAGQSLTVLDNQTSCNVLASGIYPAIPGVRYVEYQNLLSFSGGTGATGNGDDPSPLPIELASFTGYHNADKYENNLNWVTASEVNSSRFVVEKSLDGASFTYLGEKSGAGNSTTTLNYDFVDTKPALGDNYYRLKMIDKDGTFEYSKIINVNVGVGTAGSQILGIYPNPTHGMLNIRFLSGEKEKFTMRVMNTTGQVVRENTFDFAAGINFIEMNTFDFADGLYILQFVGENGGRFDGKFVKE